MPKATEAPKNKPSPVSVEKTKQEQGLDPYDTPEARGPVAVPLVGKEIKQPVVPSRFPVPEVEVECLCRGVEDRGFTFGKDAKWQTTRARAQELAGKIRITKEL
jgi:hypothetical protein